VAAVGESKKNDIDPILKDSVKEYSSLKAMMGTGRKAMLYIALDIIL
jgi:hypothetical protein